MNRNHFIKTLLLSVAMPSLLWTSCNNKQSTDKQAAVKTFTCPMHPQIVQDHAGTCPICGMDLVPFDKNNKDHFLTLDQNQQALANISTMIVGASGLEDYLAINGRFTVNPEETNFVSSRNAGRIEQLYIKETGIPIRKGQAIYKLYSEELLTLQKEYLMTYKQAEQFKDDKRFQEIFEGAKQKLLLYGQTPQQLSSLINNEKTSPYITIYAPSGGTVAEVLASEGQYVNEGTSVLRLEGYQSMWVEADIYPREASLIKEGQKLSVLVNNNSSSPVSMDVQFITPSYQNNSQIMQLRGTVPNADQSIQAGMPATILLPRTSKTAALTVPSNAIIRNGKSSHVWVALSKEKFQPRAIKTGVESFDQTEITAGLTAGDKVVVSGAYLLYSEYVLKKGGQPLD
jgi:membrane fusion protein, copper/silver efflux system